MNTVFEYGVCNLCNLRNLCGGCNRFCVSAGIEGEGGSLRVLGEAKNSTTTRTLTPDDPHAARAVSGLRRMARRGPHETEAQRLVDALAPEWLARFPALPPEEDAWSLAPGVAGAVVDATYRLCWGEIPAGARVKAILNEDGVVFRRCHWNAEHEHWGNRLGNGILRRSGKLYGCRKVLVDAAAMGALLMELRA